jgi:hypothetical protein
MPDRVSPILSPESPTRPKILDPSLEYARIEQPGDEPPAERGVVDVAVLDMNHHYPNLGHSSIVETLLGLAQRERAELGNGAPRFRVLSYDVRSGHALPVDASRFSFLVGTGGPGQLDPRRNDGSSETSQGIKEDPSWEAPLFSLFDRILDDERVAFFGICHSFGLLARWSGVADAVRRGPEKGGKSAGVVRNYLTESAHGHPWFSGLWQGSGGAEIEVLDSRFFDLVPTGHGKVDILAHEVPGGGSDGALTMFEFARDAEGVLPRVWGVNHHPEIGDRGLQRDRLNRLKARGEVTAEWVAERRAALEAWSASSKDERRLQLTNAFTFERPLRHYVARALARNRL